MHIKGGTIVDGTRVPRYRGDVWIKDGKIAQIGGRAPGVADRVIDADGLIVAPGFVDLPHPLRRPDPLGPVVHDLRLARRHVASCSATAASASRRCKPDFRERSMLTMTRTEAIPYESMVEGMPTGTGRRSPSTSTRLDRAPQGRERASSTCRRRR